MVSTQSTGLTIQIFHNFKWTHSPRLFELLIFWVFYMIRWGDRESGQIKMTKEAKDHNKKLPNGRCFWVLGESEITEIAGRRRFHRPTLVVLGIMIIETGHADAFVNVHGDVIVARWRLIAWQRATRIGCRRARHRPNEIVIVEQILARATWFVEQPFYFVRRLVGDDLGWHALLLFDSCPRICGHDHACLLRRPIIRLSRFLDDLVAFCGLDFVWEPFESCEQVLEQFIVRVVVVEIVDGFELTAGVVEHGRMLFDCWQRVLVAHCRRIVKETVECVDQQFILVNCFDHVEPMLDWIDCRRSK